MMTLFITGTPGTGKSTVSRLLSAKLSATLKFSTTLMDLNQLVEDEKLYTGVHPDWGFKIVDLDALCHRIGQKVDDLRDNEDLFDNKEDLSEDKENLSDKKDLSKNKENLVIVEGHLSHFCKGADLVVVLRAHPSILKGRLENKGFGYAKIQENLEAEALDVCAFEAFQIHGDKVNEIDTSQKSPDEVVDAIIQVLNGEKHFPAGKADFLDYLNLE